MLAPIEPNLDNLSLDLAWPVQQKVPCLFVLTNDRNLSDSAETKQEIIYEASKQLKVHNETSKVQMHASCRQAQNTRQSTQCQELNSPMPVTFRIRIFRYVLRFQLTFLPLRIARKFNSKKLLLDVQRQNIHKKSPGWGNNLIITITQHYRM